jgi:predicted methyltransferase
MGFNSVFKGLKHTLGKGLGKLYATGCDGLYCLSRVDHVPKIRDRKQRTDIGNYSFVNRTIKNWNQLPAEVSGTFP